MILIEKEHNLLMSIAKAQLAQMEVLSQLLAKNYFQLDGPVVMAAMHQIGGAIGGLEYDIKQLESYDHQYDRSDKK